MRIRIIALTLVFSIIIQIAFPVISYALTSGPTTPEVQSFSPISATDMVDPFTGDFSYNIPLLELQGPNGGYPFNLIYNAGITVDQEASWVGLGWNLNPGAINRQMRGVPDEWDGSALLNQTITRDLDIKPNWTAGGGIGGGVEVFGGSGNISAGGTVYYNSYKGVGFSINTGASISTANNSSTLGASAGIDLKIDSQEGLGVNPSLSLNHKADANTLRYTVGAEYSSREGLSGISLGMSMGAWDQKKDGRASVGSTAVLSVTSGGYTPQVDLPMKGRALDISVKLGLPIYGIYTNTSTQGFFTSNYLSQKSITNPAYGYMNIENGYKKDDALLDFNREKDGMIRKNSPNLAIPSTTFDIYSISGHGVGGMFRGFRKDVTILFDPKVTSTQAGGATGADVGISNSPHIGAHMTINGAESSSGAWSEDNDLTPLLGDFFTNNFSKPTGYERSYFKTYGEHTIDPEYQLEAIGGNLPVSPTFTQIGAGLGKKYKLNGANIKYPTQLEREPRGTLIHPVNNDKTGNSGYYVLNNDGTRYVYGKPAFNKKQVESIFSIELIDPCAKTVTVNSKNGLPDHEKGIDHFMSRTTINGNYAYAYHLTEMTGTDYVDANSNGQVDDPDYGYWVKFDYEKLDSDYNWRAPFYGASPNPGYISNKEDDKASYMYGEKEVYFLKSAETKTHKVSFETSDRWDGRGAVKELQNLGKGAQLRKLDKIILISKNEDTKPLKTIHFEYDYSLCPGVHNYAAGGSGMTYNFSNGIFSQNDPANAGGKLTLKKVYITYENNLRGGLSPYKFDYSTNLHIDKNNPAYTIESADRWGNFKKQDEGCSLPYVKQFDNNSVNFENEANRVAAWSLTSVTLPTGGKFDISYESDDYGYVQNKQAMQMFKISKLHKDGGGGIDYKRYGGDEGRRVYFELEKAVTPQDITQELHKYNDHTGKVYFNIFINLLNGSRPEYVKGYADMERLDVDGTCLTGDLYTHAYVVLGTVSGYHPFSAAAWQHIRTNEPLLVGIGSSGGIDENSGKSAIATLVKSLSRMIATINSTFTGFRAHANDFRQNWGKSLNEDHPSFIRLNSPDKKKLGGGVRVKKLQLSDEWTHGGDQKSYYGQIYDYTMQDENGLNISSGVATYEPMVGGDENVLHYPKEYNQNMPLKTPNNLYFEYPINESYYPSASVGYRKVSIRSLASYYSDTDNNNIGNIQNIPKGIMSTGSVVHEFYTSKEFPVITNETPIDNRQSKLMIPIPLIGSMSVDNLGATQGYSIELNDMNGKKRKISNYGQDKFGRLLPVPTSSIEYKYNYSINPLNGAYELISKVDVLFPVTGSKVSKQKREVGVDYEFFIDLRQSRNHATGGGIKINTDVLPIGPYLFPAFAPWPNICESTTLVRTAATNKIIHRVGIMTGMESYNDGSRQKTEYVCFDSFTGEPLLTKITNNYDDPIYDYTVPGHNIYAGMGASYENIGLQFQSYASEISSSPNGRLYSLTGGNMLNLISYLNVGDVFNVGQFIAAGNNKFVLAGVASAEVQKKVGNTLVIFSQGQFNGLKDFEVLKSGKKNMLSLPVGNLKALSDPLVELTKP